MENLYEAFFGNDLMSFVRHIHVELLEKRDFDGRAINYQALLLQVTLRGDKFNFKKQFNAYLTPTFTSEQIWGFHGRRSILSRRDLM